ncbi:hypothetical protein [uncultured Maricaulis sp.]|uniref:hypothetical protein n=1 Tax=uncultured Maricaulis sp. TaxID=174710 RepID=UPI0030D96E0F|tara:strand:- start:18759 stop:19121 length:363 start_codon:yes stop_codon:yes gene_type:complete
MRLALPALLLSATLALSGCTSVVDNFVTGGPLVRPGDTTGIIQVVNRSGYTLTSVLLSRCSAPSYGLNRLPSGVSIRPGQSYTFRVSAECWSVLAGLAGHDARQNLHVRSGGGVVYTVTG